MATDRPAARVRTRVAVPSPPPSRRRCRNRSGSTDTPRFLIVALPRPWSRSQIRTVLASRGRTAWTAYRRAKGMSTDRSALTYPTPEASSTPSAGRRPRR